MNKFSTLSLVLASLFSITHVHAAPGLLNPTQTFPDITLSNNYMIYDNTGVDADTGLLRIVSFNALLNEGPAAGNSTQTQSYAGSGDSIPDLTLSFKIANGTGSLSAGSFEGGNVLIGFGNNTTAPRFSWTGNITNFGYTANMSALDATWQLTSDVYQNMSPSFSQFVNGYLAGGQGGIKLNVFTPFSGNRTDAQLFNQDWIFGSNVATSTTVINSFIGGLVTPTRTSSTIAIDAFVTPVPEPETYALMLLGLGLIAFRRKTS